MLFRPDSLSFPDCWHSAMRTVHIHAPLESASHGASRATRIRGGNRKWRLGDCTGVTTRKLRWNGFAWAGFLLSILAFVSYFTVLVRFPATRDVPWVNFLLFGAAALFLPAGLKRAFTGLGSLGGKFVSSVLALLSISILGVFCFVVFRTTLQLPASHGAPRVGQKASDFTVRDMRGNLVSLSTLRSSSPETAPLLKRCS